MRHRVLYAVHRLRSVPFFIALFAIVGACSSAPVVDVASHEQVTEHFRFSFYGMDTASANGVLRHLESNRARVMADLQVQDMPNVHIIMHTDSSFAERWGSVIKRSGVSFQVQGLANGRDEIHVYGPWAVNHVSALNSVVLHEYAHAVTLQFAMSRGDSSHLKFSATPLPEEYKDRWLGEAIALYEANQSTDVNLVRRIRGGDYPTLIELSDPASSLIYGVGYRIIEYVRLKWGPESVLKLLLAHGDVQIALGISPTVFEDGWYDWLVGRYLILNPRLFGSSRYSARVAQAKARANR